MAESSSSMEFLVKRQDHELVKPFRPTPRQEKRLSDVDDQEAIRYHLSFIMFYAHDPFMEGEDPVLVIRDAVARALVHYYPFAGRIRQGPNGRFTVDCNGEGVVFVEADAYVTLEDLGDTIQPPCPYLKKLLHDVPGSSGLAGCPLVTIQVTRLLCGGFTFAIRWNHMIADAVGIWKFLNTVAELSRGKTSPSLVPVWRRELLNARSPPSVTHQHHEFDEVANGNDTNNNAAANMAHRSFFFGPRHVRSIRTRLPKKHQTSSTFEVLAACIWKCRTIVMRLGPDEVARLSYMVSASTKGGLKLPNGYYGNAFVFPAACSKAGILCSSPLEYALELVKEIKGRVNEEYIRSSIDAMVVKGRKQFRTDKDLVIADTSRLPYDAVDFGWGRAVYGGPAGAISGVSFFAKLRNARGEDGVVVQVSLPVETMDKFEKELVKIVGFSFDDDLSLGSTMMMMPRL